LSFAVYDIAAKIWFKNTKNMVIYGRRLNALPAKPYDYK
jgi:hypothetical protein